MPDRRRFGAIGNAVLTIPPVDLVVSFVLHRTPVEEYCHAAELMLASRLRTHVILVDNGCDTPITLLDDPRISVIEADRNLGYGRAHNLAIAASRGCSPFHLVANTDITFERDVLDELVAVMKADPHIGLCAPAITYPDGRAQANARLLPSPWDLLAKRAPFSTNTLRRRRERFLLSNWGSCLAGKCSVLPVVSCSSGATSSTRSKGSTPAFSCSAKIPTSRAGPTSWHEPCWSGRADRPYVSHRSSADLIPDAAYADGLCALFQQMGLVAIRNATPLIAPPFQLCGRVMNGRADQSVPLGVRRQVADRGTLAQEFRISYHRHIVSRRVFAQDRLDLVADRDGRFGHDHCRPARCRRDFPRGVEYIGQIGIPSPRRDGVPTAMKMASASATAGASSVVNRSVRAATLVATSWSSPGP